MGRTVRGIPGTRFPLLPVSHSYLSTLLSVFYRISYTLLLTENGGGCGTDFLFILGQRTFLRETVRIVVDSTRGPSRGETTTVTEYRIYHSRLIHSPIYPFPILGHPKMILISAPSSKCDLRWIR